MSMHQAPIELYYWPTPNGWKITIMLEECRLPYVVKSIDIGAGDQFKPEFLEISPNNKIPAIVDPAGPWGAPISIFESGAILQYLGRKMNLFYPSNDERKRVEVDQWLFWQVGGLGPMAGQAGHFLQSAPEKIPYAIQRYTEETLRLLGVMDKRLADHAFLAGADYTIADMAIWPWYGGVVLGTLYGAAEFLSVSEYKNVRRWADAIAKRPAVRRGRMVNRTWGEPSGQVPERHSASDFDGKTG
jgi:GST-like protein